MGWLRKDDHYHDHAKVDGLSDAACRLWDICGCWCRKKENFAKPGFVPRSELMFIIKRRWTEDRALELAQELVDANPGGRFTAGLWEVCPGGWRFHDWRVYQPTDDEVQLTPSERASRAGLASVAKRKAKYGSAQPVRKTHEVSNARTSSTSSPNRFETDTASTDDNTQLSLDATSTARTKPRTKPKNESSSAQVREPKDGDSSGVTELNELVRRTKPRTCRTSHFPLRDLKLKSLSQEPDRDPEPDAPASEPERERESQPSPGVVSVNTDRLEPVSACQRCENTFSGPSPEVVALFAAWRDEAKKPNAELTWRRREGFEQLVSAGVTADVVRRIVQGAKTDLEWAVGKHRLDPMAILFSPEQREKYLDIEAEKRSPPKRSGPQFMPPEPKRDPSTLVSAEQMQESLFALALGKTTPAKPKQLAKQPKVTEPVDPAAIERIDRAREKSRQALAEFDRDHHSEPPPPIALEA